MRLVCYAHDLGPARNLARIALAAIDQGHRVAFIGNDETGAKDLLDPFPDALVICGLASFKPEAELALITAAVDRGIPTLVVADTHRSWARSKAAGKVGSATIVVASPTETEAAIKFGYVRVEYIGGPPLWQEYPSIKPAEIARRDPASKIILVGGIKDAMLTDRMLGEVISAANAVCGLNRWELVFKPHPNEDEPTRDENRRARLLADVQILKTPARTTNLLASVNVSVFSGGATDIVAAAYLRAPVIFYEDDDIRQRNMKQLGEPTWYPAEAGACLKAGKDSGDWNIRPCLPMREAIAILLNTTAEGAKALRQRQKEVYPLLPKDEAVEQRILKFLSELTGKK